MEEDVETLPAVAARIRKGFPELQGRVVPVTEAQVTKDNVPSLPYAIVAPLVQNFAHNGLHEAGVTEDFVIEIWLEPAREKIEGVAESPFWSYYDYNAFRNKMFSLFAAWRTPANGEVRFISMDVESNFLATVISFRLRAIYSICAEVDEWEEPAEIVFSLCQPRSAECPPQPLQQEKDPCQSST